MQNSFKFFGSGLANSDIKAINAYGWSIHFKKGSFQNLLVKYLGVFHLGTRMRNRILTKILDGGDYSKKELLDAGCGVGLESLHLAGRFKRIQGIDLASEKIEQAKILAKKNDIRNVDFKKADLLNNVSTKGQFDVIICLEVIEHVTDDRKLIYQLGKLLKKDGELIISFPSKTFLSRVAQKYLDHYHVGYQPYDIKKFLPGTRLKIVRKYSFGKSILGKSVVALDFVFRKSIPLLAGAFFPLSYLLLVLDYNLPTFGIPRGYILVLKKGSHASN